MALDDTLALITVAMLETELGLTAGAQDDQMELLIHTVSAQLHNLLNRTLPAQTGISEEVVGYGTEKMMLKVAPISAITSISFGGTTVDSDDYEIFDADAGLVYFPSGTTWTAQRAGGTIGNINLPGTERKRYTVVYDGGYNTPVQAGTDTLPFDIQAAVLDMAKTRYFAIGRDMNIKSESILSTSVTYGKAGGNLMEIESVRQVINDYGFQPI